MTSEMGEGRHKQGSLALVTTGQLEPPGAQGSGQWSAHRGHMVSTWPVLVNGDTSAGERGDGQWSGHGQHMSAV